MMVLRRQDALVTRSQQSNDEVYSTFWTEHFRLKEIVTKVKFLSQHLVSESILLNAETSAHNTKILKEKLKLPQHSNILILIKEQLCID